MESSWRFPGGDSLPSPTLTFSPRLISPPSFLAIPFSGLSPTGLLDSPATFANSFLLSSPTIDPGTFSFDFSFRPPPAEPATCQPVAAAPEVSSGRLETVERNFVSPEERLDRTKTDDGYHWRKYGEKPMKGGDNLRSYFKCSHECCPAKKKVERSIDGNVNEIVYKGTHNHPKPPPGGSRRSCAAASHPLADPAVAAGTDAADQRCLFGALPCLMVATPENSSVSFGDGDFAAAEFDVEQPVSKSRRTEGGAGDRTLKSAKVVVQTVSDVDVLIDGFRWRKYGEKIVKGSKNPRSYYKCTAAGCQVRKHIERSSEDFRVVITTYEGKHDHDVPAPRGRLAYAAAATGGVDLFVRQDATSAAAPITKEEPASDDDLFLGSWLY